MTTYTGGSSFEIVPTNAFAEIVLAVFFIYFIFRHFMFLLMFMDVLLGWLLLGWLRKFSWYPKKGKRLETFIHWVIAVALFRGFLTVAGSVGWLKLIPH